MGDKSDVSEVSDLTLEEYLHGAYLSEKREIAELAEIMRSVLPVFLSTWDDGWPYELRNNEKVPERVASSQSTNAMIAFTLAVVSGEISESQLIPTVKPWRRSPSLIDDCAGHLDTAYSGAFGHDFKARLKEVIDGAEALSVKHVSDSNRNPEVASKSSTFGINDPLTLGWLFELFRKAGPADAVRETVQSLASKELIRVIADDKRSQLPIELGVPLVFPEEAERPRSESLPHTFPYLRWLQLALMIKSDGYRDSFWRYFENTIHLHLSYYLIPDSRFDPAELVFALEGATLSGKGRLDSGTIDRVFAVLEECQEHNPYWRPVKPFVSNERGQVLFPVSVEIANSLLRVCSRLDDGRLHDSYFTKHLGLLRRYKQWVLARAVVGATTDDDTSSEIQKFAGWHSEHVGGRETIHLWETSQVLLFLSHYESMLREHVARQSLISARFTLRRPRGPAPDEWESFEKGEPVKGTAELRAYECIGKDFIKPRQEVEPRSSMSWSMLLYGPPGTGKTTVAQKMATGLGHRLITITASDFLAEGAAAVEARAKAIFDALELQRDAVILFDEMDHFLLDRESALYREQETTFQLMTPGMLTKINDLRARKGSIFIIATNYAERIDQAIKRPGRIDQQICLLPPNRSQRRKILSAKLACDPDKIEEAANATALMTWKELDALGNSALGHSSEDRIFSLIERSKLAQPTITLGGYASRFVDEKSNVRVGSKPFLEFSALHFLQTEKEDSEYERPENAGAWKRVFTPLGLNTENGAMDKLTIEAMEALKG